MGSSDNVNLINHEYTQEKGAELLRVEGFLASSPVVIMAWGPVLVKLCPADQVGWAAGPTPVPGQGG